MSIGEKSLLLDAGILRDIPACCWTRDGEKLLLLDEGQQEMTAAGCRTWINHCCWTRDGEKPILLLDA